VDSKKTTLEADGALAQLIARGRLRPVRGQESVPTGQPLKDSTINRYRNDFDGLYKFGRRQRVIPRRHR
jgi:hypothetical protein